MQIYRFGGVFRWISKCNLGSGFPKNFTRQHRGDHGALSTLVFSSCKHLRGGRPSIRCTSTSQEHGLGGHPPLISLVCPYVWFWKTTPSGSSVFASSSTQTIARELLTFIKWLEGWKDASMEDGKMVWEYFLPPECYESLLNVSYGLVAVIYHFIIGKGISLRLDDLNQDIVEHHFGHLYHRASPAASLVGSSMVWTRCTKSSVSPYWRPTGLVNWFWLVKVCLSNFKPVYTNACVEACWRAPATHLNRILHRFDSFS